jgi:hypothetical protein
MPISLAISGLANAALANAPNYQHALAYNAVQSVLLTGRNAAMPAANLADIWGYPAIAAGQPVRVLPTAAYAMAVVSDSAADSGISTGSATGGSASFATNVMTLTVAPTVGAIQIGQAVTAAGVAAGTYIAALATGTINQVGSTYTLSTSPGTIVAESIATSAAPGAATLLISYLDALYASHYAIFVLNGTTPVTVAASIDGGAGGAVSNVLRQNGMEVLTAGANLVNIGNLYACDSTNTYAAGVPVTTTKVFDFTVAGDNVDSNCAYTIPAGYQGMLLQMIPAINDVTATPKFGKCRVGMTTGSNGIFRGFDLGGLSSNNNPVPITPALFPLIPPMSDIRMQGQVSAATEMACINQLVIWPVVGP